MHLRWTPLTIGLVTIAPLLGAAPAGAAPAKTTPVVPGPAEGVTATVAGTTVTVRFAGASAAVGRRLAGKRVSIECDEHPAPGLLLADSGRVDDNYEEVTVASDGTHVAVRLATRGDGCEITRLDTYDTVARIPLTPAGAIWADEYRHATALLDVAYAGRPGVTYRPAEALVAEGGGRVVALSGPDATPPAGQVGYWTDGGGRAAFVTLSDAGRRLVLEDVGGVTRRTNVIEAESFYVPPETGTAEGRAASDADGPHVKEYAGRPVGAAEGLRSAVSGGHVVLRFTGASARAFRAIAGHRVGVVCASLPTSPLIGAVSPDPRFSQVVVRVPRRGGTLRLPKLGAHDQCLVSDGTKIVTLAYPTPRARRFRSHGLADAMFLSGLPDAVATRGATSYPGAATVVAAHDGLVVMASPTAKLQRGVVGLWTDGAQQAVLSATAPDGRRLVLADEGGGMLRSNVADPFTLALLVGAI